ncbi:D-Ala-D-Ala carboxypeptidase family metallohydrolase [Nitrospinaceae bacterium]|nr:D-Ala-D-Ala carboxypeptidase family metallohydrolase [Nitrospinaceae bacterium]
MIEKLQKVRNIIGRPIIITSGVRCEFYNASIEASMNSSHIPDKHGIGNAVDIACTTSKDRHELVELSQKFFKRIGISGGQYGGFVHLDVDRSKVQEVIWVY